MCGDDWLLFTPKSNFVELLVLLIKYYLMSHVMGNKYNT